MFQGVIQCADEMENSIYRTFTNGVWRKYKTHTGLTKQHSDDKYQALRLSSRTVHEKKNKKRNTRSTANKSQMIKRSKPAFHWQCFRSHQVSQDNWYSLTTSTPQHGARLLRHGGLRSKHSHRHTWLLAELFFSVALSVLCSFWHVFWCVNEESVTATRSQNHVAVHNTSTQAEFCVCVKLCCYVRSSRDKLINATENAPLSRCT